MCRHECSCSSARRVSNTHTNLPQGGYLPSYKVVLPREPNPNFLVNLTWRAVKGCVTKILSMGPQELIEVAQP